MNMTPENQQLIEDLSIANRILYLEGVVDGFGHISARDAVDPSRFWIAKSMAPALVTPQDILQCDLDGVVHDTLNRTCYVERFIHSEIYRARPDVNAVVHSHSPSVIPFGVTSQRLRPICHMSGFLGSQTPIFEIRQAIGETSDLLITSQALGRSLAQSLGSHTVALMRGHGSVAVGVSIPQVVYRAIYTELNAKLQLESMKIGSIEFLTEGEAQATAVMNDQHLKRPWELWKQKALQTPQHL
jgi:HCOMODA/2-hydroxy-3-carboxy-muconic semialdehyde decarboxylase